MRSWLGILVCVVGCASSDDDAGDDHPGDTDTPDDTDTPEDTDTPADTDTPEPDPELDCTFENCDGDVVGDWIMDGICFPDLGNPFAPLCETSNYDVDYDADGTFAIHKDGTYLVSSVTTLTATATFPAACNGAVTACTDWNIAMKGLSCTGDPAIDCTCVLTVGPLPDKQSGYWEYDDGDVVFSDFGESTPDGANDIARFDYCQDGDSLVMRMKGLPIQYVLSR